jgi:hypothetical protein
VPDGEDFDNLGIDPVHHDVRRMDHAFPRTFHSARAPNRWMGDECHLNESQGTIPHQIGGLQVVRCDMAVDICQRRERSLRPARLHARRGAGTGKGLSVPSERK